jgi:hypothetical protein
MYSTSEVDRLIAHYLDKGGEVYTLEEGCLGHGLMVMMGEGLKSCVVTEVFQNHWNSVHKVRLYNKLPKKYEQMMMEII